jgi:triacylglycerol esterase/lipase EstA (alpha/beta hydrolase family)
VRPDNARFSSRKSFAKIAVWVAAMVLSIAVNPKAMADEAISSYQRKLPNAESVIIFVHGIREDGLSTWTNGSAYWPTLLTSDDAFDGVDIFVYSYPTGFWATLSIDELAENMRATLSANGVKLYKHIIFLSHSMGGLGNKSLLAQE